MFEDYSGKRPHIVDPTTGEVREVELYVAVLGASSYTFAEATLTQRLPYFIASNVRAFQFFWRNSSSRSARPAQKRRHQGVPLRACFDEMATHFGTTIMPARPSKPRDKAKVEVEVQIVQRWVLARLRNQTFFSLGELNARISELCADLNSRTMRGYGKSRREMFDEFERAALRPLPIEPFEFAEWKKARLNVDYHAEFDGHYYSAPHTLHRQELWLRATASTLEVFHAGRRQCCHARSHARGKHTTINEHMPVAHQTGGMDAKSHLGLGRKHRP